MLCVLATPVAQIEAAPREAQSHYDKGIALYEKQKYSAAQTEFEKAARGAGADDVGFSERAAYYIALCAAAGCAGRRIRTKRRENTVYDCQ